MSWIDFLDHTADLYPFKTALVEQQSGRRLTYQELNHEVTRLAQLFASNGLRAGDRLAYLALNNLEHVTFFLACAKLGALFVPLNFRLSVGEIKEILERIEPKLFLGRGEWKIDGFEMQNPDDLKMTIDQVQLTEVGLKAPLLMLFTSGSTGTPKGVLFHGEMLKSNQTETCRGWGLKASDVAMVETPFFHTGGYNVLCLPLLSLGGTVIIAEKFDVTNFIETVQSEKVSVYFGVPTMFQMISEDSRFNQIDFSSMRFFISGGAHCPVELIKTYQAKNLMFKQGFGLTEVGPNCFLLDEGDAIAKVGSIGQPMPHTEVLLMKDDGTPAKDNEVGELMLRGPHVTCGYWNEPERYRESLFDGFFKTGDLAQRDEEGFYFIAGRIKDMYISGGENVYPAEVEKVLRSHPQILEAVVVPVPHQKWGEVGMALLRSEKEMELSEVNHFLGDKLCRYKQPHFVKQLSQFPLLASGKIDKVLLKEKAHRWMQTGEWV